MVKKTVEGFVCCAKAYKFDELLFVYFHFYFYCLVRMDKEDVVHTYIAEYYSAMKKNEIRQQHASMQR